MNTVDFARSFLIFRIDYAVKPAETLSHEPPSSLNNARIQLECVCTATDKATGTSQTIVMGASCKTERVGVEKDIWIQPNADFVPCFSRDRYLMIKTYDVAGKEVPFYPPSRGMQPERQAGNVADAFDNLQLNVRRVEGDLLESPREIVAATLDPAGHPLVGRVELNEARYRTVLEFPVKTMNASERDLIYQTDTGPVLLPDFARPPDELIDGLELAFVAFNAPDCAEFIVRAPARVADGVEVYHYHEEVRYSAVCQLIALR